MNFGKYLARFVQYSKGQVSTTVKEGEGLEGVWEEGPGGGRGGWRREVERKEKGRDSH